MPLAQLFVLGDSISIGYGPALARAVEGVFSYSRKEGLDAALQDLDIPQGANGGDSSMCLAYLQARRDAGVAPVDLLLLNCGLHDIKVVPPDGGERQMSIDAYRQNLRQILALAPALARHLIWVRTTPVDEAAHNARPDRGFSRYNADVDAYNQAADQIMAEHQIPAIDLHRFSLNLGTPDQTLHDGRHFHEPLSDQQGAFIAGWLIAWWREVGARV